MPQATRVAPTASTADAGKHAVPPDAQLVSVRPPMLHAIAAAALACLSAARAWNMKTASDLRAVAFARRRGCGLLRPGTGWVHLLHADRRWRRTRAPSAAGANGHVAFLSPRANFYIWNALPHQHFPYAIN